MNLKLISLMLGAGMLALSGCATCESSSDAKDVKPAVKQCDHGKGGAMKGGCDHGKGGAMKGDCDHGKGGAMKGGCDHGKGGIKGGCDHGKQAPKAPEAPAAPATK